MQPLKPYFRGEEEPPYAAADLVPEELPHGRHRERRASPPATSPSSRCSATSRSGDYFKQGAVEYALGALHRRASASTPSRSGSRSSAATRSSGSGPTTRRSSAGARSASRTSGSCCSVARTTSGSPGRPARAAPARSSTSTAASTSAARTDRPGDDTERFLEFWNLVFMQYDLHEDGSLTELPTQNIDTGLGLERMAAILQDVPSVFETDQLPAADRARGGAVGAQLRPGRAAPPARCGSSPTTVAAMTFLLADGVVPSNEERGYVLRRIMRRAIQQGHVLGIEGAFLPRAVRARDRGDGRRLPGAERERPTRSERWARAEEESFGRTLEQGERLLGERDRAREGGADLVGLRRGRLPAARHLRLPLRADQGAARRGGPVGGRPGLRGADGAARASVAPRRRARAAGAAASGHEQGDRVRARRRLPDAASSATRRPRRTTVLRGARARERLRCWRSSRRAPSTPRAAARCPTAGWSRRRPGARAWSDVYRLGDDQALALEPVRGRARGRASRPRRSSTATTRLATMRNHTATHLLHAALRERARHARAPGRLVRGPGQAALRLHPRRAALRRRAGGGRGGS